MAEPADRRRQEQTPERGERTDEFNRGRTTFGEYEQRAGREHLEPEEQQHDAPEAQPGPLPDPSAEEGHNHVPRGAHRPHSISPMPPGQYPGESGYGVQGDYSDEGAYGYAGGYGAGGGVDPRTRYEHEGGYSSPGGYTPRGGYSGLSRTGNYPASPSRPGPREQSQGGYGTYPGYDIPGQPGRRPHPRYGSPPRGYQRTDQRIREDICDTIMRNAYVDASEVSVDVEDGEVHLSGHVDERYQKHIIEDIADSVLGVRDVDNRIRVKRPERMHRE